MKRFVLLAAVLGACFGGAGATVQPIEINTGLQNNEGSGPRLAFTAIATATNGWPRTRIRFSAHQLGTRSYARLQSLQDGQEQRLNTAAMRNWSDTSAIFNGSAIRVELYVAPGDQDVFFHADALLSDFANGGVIDLGWRGPLPGAETLCGGDDRVASTDNRVGRIPGCTAWLVSNGGVLTAGHCPIGS